MSTSELDPRGDLPLSCEGCYLPYGDFVATYYKNCEGLVKLGMKHGLLLEMKLCEKCGRECRVDVYRKAFRCGLSYQKGKKARKKCNFYQSLYKGTWLGRSHCSIETNMCFLNFFVQDFFSYEVARNELQLSDLSISEWASFAREVLVAWCIRQEEKIGGVGQIVEIDEAEFGKRKLSVGQVVEGQWVFGGFCRNFRSCFMVPVEKRDRHTLASIIEDRILPGTTIISDCLKTYKCLESEEFQQLTVNHSYKFLDMESGVHPDSVEQHWREVKQRVPMIGRKKKPFVGYLATSMFKMRFPDSKKRFHVLIKEIAKLYPPPSA